jgi:hypothetical protein
MVNYHKNSTGGTDSARTHCILQEFCIDNMCSFQVEAEKRAVQIRHQEQIRFDRERQIRQVRASLLWRQGRAFCVH